MAARVLLFGRLADIAGWREKRLDPGPASLAALEAAISAEDPDLAAALRAPGVRVAVDKAIVAGDVSLAPDTEVAFMPPMSGG